MKFTNEKLTTSKLKYLVNLARFTDGVSKTFSDPLDYNSVVGEDRNGVGRIGEEMYNLYLTTILDSTTCKIQWVNEEKELGEPYDFILNIGDDEYIVDVKATKGPSTNSIYMSSREYEFAEKTPNYKIARLFEWETDKGKYRAGNFNLQLLTLEEAEPFIIKT